MSSSRRGRSLAEVMAPIEDEDTAPPRSQSVSGNSQPAPDAAPRLATGAVGSGQAVVPINVLVAPEDRRRLKQLSLDCNLSLQKLGHEAWNLLLQKRGLPPLKPVSANIPSGRSNGRPRQ